MAIIRFFEPIKISPQTAPPQQPLEGRENDIQLRQPHNDTLYTPGMRSQHHCSDTTYHSSNFVCLVPNRYSLTMIWCWDLHIVTQSHDLYGEILIGSKNMFQPWMAETCCFDINS